MAYTALYGILATLAAIFLLDSYFCRRRHPQEPICVRPRIPLCGHLLGIVMNGSKYYSIVSPGQPEIFALPILTFRIYVVNSRHLFPVIQRHARTVSFRPFTKLASQNWCDASPEFVAMHGEGHPWIEDLYTDTRRALAPGKALDYQNIMTGQSLQRFIEKLDNQLSSKRQGFDLYDWIHHVFSVAPSDGVYGKNNPFRDPEVEKNYWLWTSGIGKQTANFPRVFLRKEIQARNMVFAAFEKYWSSDWSDAAEITKARKHLYDREGVSIEDQAANQASFNLALLGNTVPTAFWALYETISRPQLLGAIQAELEANAIVRVPGKEDVPTTIELDVAALRTSCPLLLSAYQEMQRNRSVHANIREIMSDTFITSPTSDEKYHLCKGQYLQMPSGPIHTDPSIWGSSAPEYDPYRFVKDNAPIPKSELPNSYAFLPWGSAPHLCPARQFASTEVLLFVALMVLRFDFEQTGGGEWKTPEPKVGELVTIMPPATQPLVDITRRAGWEGKWVLKMGESSKRVPLATG